MITPEERAKRERVLHAVQANLRLEGMFLDPADLALYEQYNQGAISEEELDLALDALCEQRFGPLSVPQVKHA